MTSAYDLVEYPNLCQVQTHPDRLAVVANLFGIDPAPPDSCKVLEIGCGTGANLLPLAAAFPSSNFTGIDLAGTAIAAGQAAIRELGLANFSLHHLDIRDFQSAPAHFDYVIAHGVYSWIPADARDALLAVIHRSLAAHGVAYVSYNCLPGCHLRRLVREIMRFHTRAVTDPVERVRQAVAICQFIANSIEKPDTYRQLFKDQLEQVLRYGTGHLFHDDLADVNDPVYFHEFMAHAERHGLQYLGEADFFEMQDEAFSAEARAILAQMQDSRLTREQYLDFIKCRRFRQTLLCRVDAPVRPSAQATAVERFHLSSRAQAAPHGKSPDGHPITRFSETRGGALEVGHPLGVCALQRLSSVWPATIPFEELFTESLEAVQFPGPEGIQARSELAEILLEGYRAGIVDFRRSPVRCAVRPPLRPKAYWLARWQLGRSSTVTTLRGENLRVEDPNGKCLLRLLDGTRTLSEIGPLLVQEIPDALGKEGEQESQLDRRVEELTRLALLEP